MLLLGRYVDVDVGALGDIRRLLEPRGVRRVRGRAKLGVSAQHGSARVG
jgi:hypothetical protein